MKVYKRFACYHAGQDGQMRVRMQPSTCNGDSPLPLLPRPASRAEIDGWIDLALDDAVSMGGFHSADALALWVTSRANDIARHALANWGRA